MKVELYLTARDGSYNASGLYDNGNVIVKKGSRIRLYFAPHIRGGNTAKKYRDNPSIVDQNGVTLQDCSFSSPSTAAQFVKGCSVNGLIAWRVNKTTNLKKYIEQFEKDDKN